MNLELTGRRFVRRAGRGPLDVVRGTRAGVIPAEFADLSLHSKTYLEEYTLCNSDIPLTQNGPRP